MAKKPTKARCPRGADIDRLQKLARYAAIDVQKLTDRVEILEGRTLPPRQSGPTLRDLMRRYAPPNGELSPPSKGR